MRLVWAIFFGFLAGCTVLGSHTPLELTKNSQSAAGVHYSLPRGYVDVALYADAENVVFTLVVGNPYFDGDSEHQYFLKYRPLANYDDEITVETTPKGLLKKVHSTTEDRTDDIIVNIAGAVGALGDFEVDAVAPPAGNHLYSIPIDPGREDQVALARWALNDRLLMHVRGQARACDDVVYRAGKSLKGTEDVRLKAAEKSIEVSETKALEKKSTDEHTTALEAYLKEKSKKNRDILIGKKQALRDVTKKLAAATAEATAAEQTATTAEGAAKATPACKGYRSVHRRVVAGLVRACRHERKPVAELKARCVRYEQEWSDLKLQSDRSLWAEPLLLRLDIEAPPPPPKTKPADCKIGICYRVKAPYTITYWVGDARYSKLVELPNSSPLVSIDIERAFLVQKIQQIDFDDDGFLTKIRIEKKSELAAATAIPLAIITAIADAIPLRAKIYTEKKNLIEKEAALAEARAKLRAMESGLESRPVGERPARRAGGSNSFRID